MSSFLVEVAKKGTRVLLLLGLLYAVIYGGLWFWAGFGFGIMIAYLLLSLDHPIITQIKSIVNYEK